MDRAGLQLWRKIFPSLCFTQHFSRLPNIYHALSLWIKFLIQPTLSMVLFSAHGRNANIHPRRWQPPHQIKNKLPSTRRLQFIKQTLFVSEFPCKSRASPQNAICNFLSANGPRRPIHVGLCCPAAAAPPEQLVKMTFPCNLPSWKWSHYLWHVAENNNNRNQAAKPAKIYSLKSCATKATFRTGYKWQAALIFH